MIYETKNHLIRVLGCAVQVIRDDMVTFSRVWDTPAQARRSARRLITLCEDTEADEARREDYWQAHLQDVRDGYARGIRWI